MDNITKKEALKRLNYLIGHLRGVKKMLEKDRYCIDIIQQNLAVIGLLKSTNLNLLENHMNCCVKKAISSQDQSEINTKMQEILKIVQIAQNK